MTELKDILITGKAPNKDYNVTTGMALAMQYYWFEFLKGTTEVVGEIFVNETVSGPVEAKMIPLSDITPQPRDNMKFFWALRVESPNAGTAFFWDVHSFLKAIEVRGLEVATRDYLKQLNPGLEYLNIPHTYAAIEDSLNYLYAMARDGHEESEEPEEPELQGA
ncbi:MAG TPA: hypothetical protein VF077_00320 [Nitrospiraceae bacterium]